MAQTDPSRRRASLLAILIALLVVGAAVAVVLSLYSAPALSPAAASATSEAQKFATAEVSRQSTSVAVRRTATAGSRATGTAEAIARSTRLVQASATAVAAAQSTSTAAAVASAIAPATQTARAKTDADRLAEAEAAVQSMESQATLAYGPTSGALDPHTDSTASCAESNLTLHNFIVFARFYNPSPAAQNSWEHGIAFSNEGVGTEFIFSIRSTGEYALRLSGRSFYIENNNTTDLIDLSRAGDNTLKLYVQDDTAYLYINGLYADTMDLSNLTYGQPTARDHSPMACASLGDPSAVEPPPANVPTRYQDFAVWSLP